jgi:hypothetical protein
MPGRHPRLPRNLQQQTPATPQLSLFSEFEHTSSAISLVWCAAVVATGRISYSTTSWP